MGIAGTTEYLVRTRYETTGDTSKVEALAKAADRASDSFDRLRHMAMGVGASILGGRLFELGKEHLIEFNSNLEQAKLTMSGLYTAMKGGTVESNMSRANDLVDRLQQRSKATTSTTMELVNVAAALSAPIMNAGGSMKDLENFTVGASVAAKALGTNSDQAAMYITEALQGNWTRRNMFMNKLMAPTHMDHKAFNALSESARYDIISKQLNAPWLKQLAEAQRTSFAGVTSTLKDNIEIALGKVGLPLFKAISAEINRWNTWFDEHPKELADFTKKAADALITGFNAMKTAFEWVWNHHAVIEDLIKLAVLMKAGSMAGSLVGGAGKLLGGFGKLGGGDLFSSLSYVGAEVNKEGVLVANSFKAVAASAGPVLAAFAGGYGLGSLLMNAHDRTAAADKASTMRQGPLADAIYEMDKVTKMQEGRLANSAMRTGLLRGGFSFATGKVGYSVDQEKLAASVGRQDDYRMMQAGFRDYVKSTQEIIVEHRLLRYAIEGWRTTLADATAMAKNGLLVGQLITELDKETKRLGGARPAATNITVQRVEVSAKDPDRWIQDLEDETRRRARSPRRSRSAPRGGGL